MSTEDMLHPVTAEAVRAGVPLAMEGLSMLDWCELQAWRRYGGQVQLAIEELLRLQGDSARRETIALQHVITELRQTPFGGNHRLPNPTFP